MDNMFHFTCFVAHAKAFHLILSFVFCFARSVSHLLNMMQNHFHNRIVFLVSEKRVKGSIVYKSTPYVWAHVWHGASNVRIHTDFLSESAKPVKSAALCATFLIAHAAIVLL